LKNSKRGFSNVRVLIDEKDKVAYQKRLPNDHCWSSVSSDRMRHRCGG